MFKAKLAAAIFAGSFVALFALGSVRNLEAQQNNPGAQISGAVVAGHCTKFGPGLGQISDNGGTCGAAAPVQTVFGRAGAVVAAASDYTFSQIAGSLACGQMPALTGDATSSAGACGTVLATVNANVGAFGGSNSIPSFTVNGKGLITAAAANVPSIPFSEITSTPTTLAGYGITSPLPYAQGGCNATTQTGCTNNVFPAPTRAGDIVFWNGTTWVTLAGNNAGTLILQETAAGVPSWVAAGAGTVTSVVCATTTITTTGTCYSRGQVVGTNTNDAATAGNYGEHITSSVASGSAVVVNPTGTVVNITSVSLTAGDWICTGNAFTQNSIVVNSENAWISTTSASNPSAPNSGAYLQNGGLTSSANIGGPVGSIHLSLAGTTTTYLSGLTNFSSGTGALYGSIDCVRGR